MNAATTILDPPLQGEGGKRSAAGWGRVQRAPGSPPPPSPPLAGEGRSLAGEGGFVLTGRKVFLIFVLFFGTIASADAFLIVSALRSWSGAETTSAYKAGQLYNAEIALARAQAARGWRLDAEAMRSEGAGVLVRVEARDAAGRALQGHAVSASLQRPADKRGDRAVTLAETQAGSYAGSLEDVAPGQWNLVVDVMEGGERAHRLKTRVVLR